MADDVLTVLTALGGLKRICEHASHNAPVLRHPHRVRPDSLEDSDG